MDRKQRVQQVFFSRSGAEHWSRMYEKATNLFEDNMVHRRDYVCDYARRNVTPTARALDLGCGTGVIAEQLAAAGMAVVAMDLSQEMVESAKSRLTPHSSENHRVLRGDCERLPFRDGEFDLIVCLGVISFLRSDQHVLAEIRRVLRDGGTLILSVRNKYALQKIMDPVRAIRSWLGRYFHKLLRGLTARSGHEHDEVPLPRFYRIPHLAETLQNSGFKLVEKKYIGYGPLTIYGREILPAQWSISLSNLLERAFAKLRMRYLADVCVLVSAKDTVTAN